METGKVIFIILFLIFVLGVLLSVYAFKDTVANFFNIDPSSSNLGLRSYIFLPDFNSRVASEGGSSEFSTSNNIQEVDIKDEDIPEGFERDDLSPYFDKFRLRVSNVSSGFTNTLENPSRITLSVKVEEGESIPITGWTIKSFNDSIKIPKAVQYYVPPSGGPEFDIILKEGSHNINIYSSNSALSKNFRENKCSGYLTNDTDFIPRIRGDCAKVDLKSLGKLSGSCRNLLNSLNNSCRNPLLETGFNYPSGNYCSGLFDPTYCRNDFLDCRENFDEFNYAACYDREKDAQDFLDSDWHIWVGINILDPVDDNIGLYDSNGKLVAEYKY